MQGLIINLENTISQLNAVKKGTIDLVSSELTPQQVHTIVQAEMNLLDSIEYAKKSLQKLQYLQKGLAIVK